MRTTRKHQRGFTLIEIGLLFSIIALFASTMALTVRRALQAKVADATMQLSNAGKTGGTSITLNGMKAYEPATQTSNITTSQNQTTTSDYDKGKTDYGSNVDVDRKGKETTAGAENVGDDKTWTTTSW